MLDKTKRAAGAALVVVMAACAVPLQPDLTARAPDLPGFGRLQWTVATASPAAQRLFNQGVLQAYAFNEAEAVRMFPEGRHDEALQLQAQAVAASKEADDNEPPMLAAGARLALGELQLRAGRAAAAEATFRADLAAQPGSGWALSGLSRALAAQGRADHSRALQEPLTQAWPVADPALLARR